MKKITIVGIGLIGGSIGRDIKRLKMAEVCGVVRRKESIEESINLKAVDHATLDIEEGVKDADLIIFATPVSTTIKISKEAKKYIDNKSFIIDVVSVKGKLVAELEGIFGSNYLGTHQMAGSEKRGAASAEDNLFKDSTCILTPTKNTNPKVVEVVDKFWKDLGARTINLSPDEHDKLVALTSHMPHLIAASLINTVKPEDKAISCIGPGFKDATRIAGSNPGLWQEICEWNQSGVLFSLERFLNEITDVKKIVEDGRWDELLKKLSQAKEYRDKI